MSMYKWKSGKFAYKTGFSFTKRESRLQNEIFIYKERLLGYKRDSRSTFHPLKDDAGNTYSYVDEEMRNRLQVRLITRTLAFHVG